MTGDSWQLRNDHSKATEPRSIKHHALMEQGRGGDWGAKGALQMRQGRGRTNWPGTNVVDG